MGNLDTICISVRGLGVLYSMQYSNSILIVCNLMSNIVFVYLCERVTQLPGFKFILLTKIFMYEELIRNLVYLVY